jgi:nucleoside-diphosphate-sugar epimerase
MAEKITGVHAPRWHPGPGAMRAIAGLMGIVGKVVPLPEDYHAETLRTMAGVTYIGSNEKAKRELGYHPRSLEAGLRETLVYEKHQLEEAHR